ncbi:MAG: hypothetical protein AB7Y46_03500 [Armatimonadota bacterium]
MTRIVRAAALALFFTASVGPAAAIDLRELPDAVRGSIIPVHIDWAEVYPGLVEVAEPVPSEGAVLVSTLRTLIEQGELAEDGIAEYCTENDIADETIVRALESIELSHPMKSPYYGLCAALWARLGEDAEKCLDLPYAARIYMATYIATLGRTEDARRLVLSLPEDDPMRLSADIYHIANELAAYRDTAHGLAIWIWKRGATMRGPAEQAFVCRHIVLACYFWSRQGEEGCWEREALPWIEEALARPGAEPRWGEALRALVDVYCVRGNSVAGVEKAMRLLEQVRAEGRPVPPSQIAWAHLLVAYVIMAERFVDRYGDAERMLRQAIEAGEPGVRQRAQYELLRLAEVHPVEAPMILPPEVWEVTPERVVLSPGETDDNTVARVVIDGSATLRIEGYSADLESLALEQTKSGGPTDGPARTVYRHEIQVSLRPEFAGGTARGELTITTNSEALPVIRIPVAVGADDGE